jgi:hypothetical protein
VGISISRRIVGTAVLAAALAFPVGVLASHQFSDVPDSNPFHDHIDAIVDHGITLGCGGGKYCPKDYVTREQMAAFLNRLGSLDGSTPPSVNADQVDGVDATNLMPGGDPPYGMTIRGGFAMNGTSLKWESFSFGYELSQSPTPHYVPAGTASPVGCPGTATNPEADPGHLCIYEVSANVSGNPGFDCVFSPTSSSCGTAGRWGFGLAQNGDAGGWYAGGTWAVTEPLTIIFPFSEDEEPPAQVGDGRSAFGTSE